jgi:hypothetical protein
VTSWNRPEVTPFIVKVLNEVVKDELPAARGSCGLILLEDFSDISFKQEAKRLISLVLHDRSSITRYGIAQALQNYFGEIPSDIALECLQLLSHDRNGEIRAAIVSTFGRNIGRLPLDSALKVVSEALDDRAAWVRLAAVGEVHYNMRVFPEDVVKKAISCCKALCNYSGWNIRYLAWISCHSFEQDFKKFKANPSKTIKHVFEF